MKKYFLLVLCSLALVSCGGGGSDGPEGSLIDLDIELPSALSGLETGSLKVHGSLVNESGVSVADVSAKAGGTEGSGYQLDLSGSRPGKYMLRLNLGYASSYPEVAVASAEKSLSLVAGQQTVTITEPDFTDIGGGDADGDGLDNLTELNRGLNPFLSDTDGDGMPDASDMFPTVNTEWADTDGDGIGDNTDPDIDGDGLDNDTELKLGTDKFKADSDGDGINDGKDNCKLAANADQKDTDGDGSGDACDDDTDGDGLTNEQEVKLGTNILLADTDGDGLADKIEVDAKLDPFAADTDGDGVNDKEDKFPLDPAERADADGDGVGDNSDNCPNVPNKDQANTDKRLAFEGKNAVADRCGDACECDCDNDVDGDGENFVYVDNASGSDDNLGVFAEPVKTVQKGILLAYQRNEKAVMVAGSAAAYDLAGVTFMPGINLLGAYDGASFDDHSNVRDIRSDSAPYRAELYNSGSSTTLSIGQDIGSITIEGFHIKNTANVENSTTVRLDNASAVLMGNTIYSNEAAGFSKGIYVSGGTPKIDKNWVDKNGNGNGVENIGILVESGAPAITNNIVKAGKAKHTVALKILNSPAIVVNNTLDGTSLANVPGTAFGFIFENSEPVVVNNIIVAEPLEDGDAIAMRCRGDSPEAGEFRNNLLSTFTTNTSDAVFVDCDEQYYYSADFGIGDLPASKISGNIVFAGGFGGLFSVPDPSKPYVTGYVLVGAGGSDGVDDGISAGSTTYGKVDKDFGYIERPRGGIYDIGAEEK